MKYRRFNLLFLLPVAILAAFLIALVIRKSSFSPMNSTANRKTVADRLREFGDAARVRLQPGFERAHVKYPPASVEWVAIKSDQIMKVYASDAGGPLRWIHTYPIMKASGHAGPKLKEGDLQVPEGIYPIELLNPNSAYHVSLRVGYPNDFDRAMAAKEGRSNLGGDIMIHGKAVSVGCLAMGDETAEDLFVLAADTGIQNIKVVIAPVDFQTGKSVADSVSLPSWCGGLYAQIKKELATLPREELQ